MNVVVALLTILENVYSGVHWGGGSSPLTPLGVPGGPAPPGKYKIKRKQILKVKPDNNKDYGFV